MNARTQAIAAQNEAIQRNVAMIKEQKARPTAIQAMASRLNITPQKLQDTLLATVFKEASQEEFAALIVVANELELNPLKKEIYAFPSRGGVTPMIAYDGWISIANRHPQFDGSEQNEVFVDGKFVGVETVIYRKDRSHPVKKTIYHDEFKMNTEPWKQKPMHMTAMRSFCHAARLALGVSGVLVEDDYNTIDLTVQNSVVPTSRQLQQHQQQQQPTQDHDPETGEIIDDAETDAAAEREAERLNGASDDHNEARDALDQSDERPMWVHHYDKTLAAVLAAQSMTDVKAAETDFVNNRVTYDDEAIAEIEREIASAKKRFA
jgi:hypothetical protein